MKISGKLRRNVVLDILIFMYILEDILGAVVQECSESNFVKFVSPHFFFSWFLSRCGRWCVIAQDSAGTGSGEFY